MDMLSPTRAADVLRFWFGAADPSAEVPAREAWFKKEAAFDRAIDEEFGIEVEMALAGGLGEWRPSPAGLLALILLLDQFTRNIHRGSAKAFAGDVRALALARQAIDAGTDAKFGLRQRLFLYLPLEHSEALADQDRSVALIGALGDPEATRYAQAHRAIIARFGRFPHRNAVLGRQSTIEELRFLEQPGSAF